MSNNIAEILKNEIKILSVVETLGGLNLTKMGHNLMGNCPTGHSSSSGKCFSVDLSGDYFHCFNCKKGGDIFELVNIVKGFEFKESLKFLCETFRPDLLKQISNQDYSNYSPKVKEYYQKGNYYDYIFQLGKELLYAPEGKDCLDYLINQRGYELENLKKTEWMYFPNREKIKNHLKTSYPEIKLEEIDSLPLNGYFGDNFRLAIPYRDRKGIITGFMKRSIFPTGIDITTHDGKEHKNVRWDSTKGLNKDDLFNLHACRSQKELIILEGIPDGAYLPTLGFKNVVSVSQGVLSNNHLEGLKSLGIKKVILSFDNDKPDAEGKMTGFENTKKALEILRNTDLEVFVLDPRWFIECKDPDEYIAKHGVETFASLLKEVVFSSKFIVDYYFKKYDIENDIEKSAFIENVIDYTDHLPAHKAREGEECLKYLADITEISLDSIFSEYDYVKSLRLKEEEFKSYGELLNESFKLHKENRIDTLKDLLLTKTQEINARSVKPLDIFYPVDDFINDLKNSPEGLKTGFRELDENLIIPSGAISVVMGKSGHGKTTFLMNMFLNMIKIYPTKTFIFFSYEEEKRDIMTKLAIILNPKEISKANFFDTKGYLINDLGSGKEKELENAYKTLKNYVDERRLALVYEPLEVNQLCDNLTRLSGIYDIGGVFIDYIQRIPTKVRYQSRQLELQSVSNLLLQTAIKLNLPVILGAQVSKDVIGPPKDKNVREAGDILQDANIVLSIFNPLKEKFEEERDIKFSIAEKIPFEVYIAKSRNGISNNKKIEMDFFSSTLKIKNKSFY